LSDADESGSLGVLPKQPIAGTVRATAGTAMSIGTVAEQRLAKYQRIDAALILDRNYSEFRKGPIEKDFAVDADVSVQCGGAS
jgi:hypothetical protein